MENILYIIRKGKRVHYMKLKQVDPVLMKGIFGSIPYVVFVVLGRNQKYKRVTYHNLATDSGQQTYKTKFELLKAIRQTYKRERIHPEVLVEIEKSMKVEPEKWA